MSTWLTEVLPSRRMLIGVLVASDNAHAGLQESEPYLGLVDALG